LHHPADQGKIATEAFVTCAVSRVCSPPPIDRTAERLASDFLRACDISRRFGPAAIQRSHSSHSADGSCMSPKARKLDVTAANFVVFDASAGCAVLLSSCPLFTASSHIITFRRRNRRLSSSLADLLVLAQSYHTAAE